MGMSATFTFADQRWSVDEEEIADPGAHPEPFFSASVHDSDLVTVAYEPGPPAGGLVYLGFQPRDYFDDPDESDDVDLDVQADGLARWAAAVTGSSVAAAAIRPLLAEAVVEDPVDDFAEDTLQKLISLLGLPVPGELVEE
ncbi:hypothetical protein NS263_09735 [Curtobacterium oceanosedimentum]|uniref:Uncharacterized protein n=1 Tax=Curtobacterium oceanosedimentum TaxID=465820 RepID=A0ABR5S6R7_9MICO|nr:hypothetical protein [Curtobacterium oceanosedimentum]KTR39681.1 hypothetical protein NS263_09735 [Curtobacterium oceanosedimentum]